MPRRREIDQRFLDRPFPTSEFVSCGYSEKILRGRRFRRVFPQVWVAVEHPMSARDVIEAGRMTMPPEAALTDVTRFRLLGLELGPLTPLHFVISSDLHLATPGIVLHRTVAMPPTDADGVTPAAAFLAYCAHANLIDAVAAGDWLLHRKFMTLAELNDLVATQAWRDGAREVRYLFGMLVERSRSLPESRLRLILTSAGIEGIEVNALLSAPDGRGVELDLLARGPGLAIEYEGSHHQEDRRQYLTDIDRHEILRQMRLEYLLVTKEHMHHPQAVVARVHQRLLSRGYDGPAPIFGTQWHNLFRPVHDLVRNRVPRQRPAASATSLAAPLQTSTRSRPR